MHTATNKWGICIHVGRIVCWALGHCTRCTHCSWANMDTWRITFSNQTSKTAKITGRNWLDSRVTEGGSRGIFWSRHLQLSISFLNPGAFLTRGSSLPSECCLKSCVPFRRLTSVRPIASSRLFYKVFGYLVLSRVEEILEAKQPEEQHGYRPGRRLEEHLLTANLLLDKAAAAGITVWIDKFRLVKGIWPRTLANIVGSSTRTRGSRTLNVVVRECIWWTTRRGHGRMG